MNFETIMQNYFWYIAIPLLVGVLYLASLKIPLRNILNFIFRLLSDLIGDAEKSFQDLLMAIVPYAVPIIPAYLTIDHVERYMDFPTWVAWTAGFVVETFGLVAVTTAIKFYYHNAKYASAQNKAPFVPALLTYVFYVAIVITVNVILEVVSGSRSGAVILTIALFSLLSIPSGVLIAIRTQYSQVLEAIEERYSKGKGGGSKPEQVPSPSGAYSQKPASHYRDKITAMLEAEYSKSKNVLTPKQITSRLKIDHARNKGYVSTLTKEWRTGKGI